MSQSKINQTDTATARGSVAIQEPVPDPKDIPSFTDDVGLVLALRRRDGFIDSIRPHRDQGVCKYMTLYAPGDCEWCKALERNESSQRAAERSRGVVLMSWPVLWADSVLARTI